MIVLFTALFRITLFQTRYAESSLVVMNRVPDSGIATS